MVPSGMGTVYAKVIFLSDDRTREEAVELIVDTGSLFTWVPEGLMSRLGARPTRTRRFRTIDGSVIDRPVGACRVSCEGEESYIPVVFGRAGDASVSGVTALEVLGLEVDPQNHRLRRVDAFIAYATAYAIA
jgi:predicted aspartyl protease